VAGEGFFESAHFLEDDALVIKRFRVIWIQLKSELNVSQGLLEVALFKGLKCQQVLSF